MIPLELDREDEVGGLVDFITTNVMGPSRPLTTADLISFAEGALPAVFSREFEVGPEDMFPAV